MGTQLPPPQKGAQEPQLFSPCLLWPNGRPSQQLLSCCYFLESRNRCPTRGSATHHLAYVSSVRLPVRLFVCVGQATSACITFRQATTVLFKLPAITTIVTVTIEYYLKTYREYTLTSKSVNSVDQIIPFLGSHLQNGSTYAIGPFCMSVLSVLSVTLLYGGQTVG